MQVLKVDFGEENLGELIDQEFNKYARKYNIRVDYNDFCFVAKDDDKVIGILVGHSYYNEVHITDLIVIEEYRSKGVGTELIRRVEQEFTGRNFENINLTTFAFQAPEFYKKMGFEVEHVRKSSDEKLTKYFLIKHINYIRD
ncbi:MAG: GNAT family N-acetyltransferase [Treponema sp.]|nr:GNAT family N-acetyltransferase [Treponema sp.]